MELTKKAAKNLRKRRPQERAELTKNKILQTATRLFSERGYDAATIRDIEVQAGVQRNSLTYHFDSKENLWKTVASRLLEQLNSFNEVRQELMQDLPVHERIAYIIRSYVRFCATHPEFSRIMTEEGKQDSWRIQWLVNEYLQPAMEQLRESVEEDLNITDDEFMNWYYIFVGGGAQPFTMAPEAAQLFGVDVHSEDVIERHAKMMVDFLLSRETRA